LRASVDDGASTNTWRLDAGVHTFRMNEAEPALLVWSPVLARGLDPATLWANARP
jgi:hypothetical protein